MHEMKAKTSVWTKACDYTFAENLFSAVYIYVDIFEIYRESFSIYIWSEAITNSLYE